MKLSNYLNKLYAHMWWWLPGEDELILEFQPSYWAKEKPTKHDEAYILKDGGNDDKELAVFTREDLESVINTLQEILKVVDNEIKL